MSEESQDASWFASIHREDVHLHVHLDPLVINVQHPRQAGTAVTAILTIGGSLMPAQISIDATGKANVFWIDDKGDTDANAPDGAVVQYGVDNPAVASVDPNSGQLTPVAEGSGNATVTITDANGNPLMEPDGVTAFSAPPAPFQVVAGAAVGAGLAIQS